MKIKSLLFYVLIAFCFSFQLNSQILEPVKWESKVEKVSENEYKVIIQANIDKGWYIYSQHQQSKESFAPTTFFEFTNQENNYTLIGEFAEPSVAPIFDKIFEENVVKFKDTAVFEQLIAISNSELSQVDLIVEYQTCDDSKCIPGDYTFNISLDGSDITKEITEIDDRSKELSESLNLNVTGWDKFESQTIKKKGNFSIFLLGFLGGLILHCFE